MGSNWIDRLIPAPKKKDLINYMKSLIEFEPGTTKHFENAVLTASGKERIIKWRNSVLIDEKGEASYIIAAGEDITSKKRGELIQQVISSILEAANTESDLNEIFRFIHSAVGQLMPVENFYIALHEKENNLITFPYFVDKVDKLVPPKRLGKGLTEYVLRTGKSMLVTKETDKELMHKGEVELLGSPASIWLGIPLKIQDNIIGVLVVQDYDNTETYGETEKEILEVISYAVSRAIERKIVEHEKNDLIKKLSELNASKDKLISLISHDLRSPFNSLLGFSEILTTEYDTLTRDEIQEYLRVIFEASKNLYGMTNNLLQFSRFQTGRYEFNPVKLKLLKLINTCLNLLKGNALKKQQNLMIDIDKDIYIIADEDMLNSVIQNLLSNAIKFTKKGGDIRLTAKKKSRSGEPPEIEITVEDSGVGISVEDLDKIFDETTYSTPGTEREYGTGLGLIIVKEFVELNGGKLNVHSSINRGSTFSFTIPAAE